MIDDASELLSSSRPQFINAASQSIGVINHLFNQMLNTPLYPVLPSQHHGYHRTTLAHHGPTEIPLISSQRRSQLGIDMTGKTSRVITLIIYPPSNDSADALSMVWNVRNLNTATVVKIPSLCDL